MFDELSLYMLLHLSKWYKIVVLVFNQRPKIK